MRKLTQTQFEASNSVKKWQILSHLSGLRDSSIKFQGIEVTSPKCKGKTLKAESEKGLKLLLEGKMREVSKDG